LDVLFLANGSSGSAAGERARRIAAAVSEVVPGTEVVVEFRQGGRSSDLKRFARAANRCTGVAYAVDLALTPVLAAAKRRRGAALVVDTGDWPSAFFDLIGARAARTAANALERWVYRTADTIVVRSTAHAAVVDPRSRGGVVTVPDGVDRSSFRPYEDHDLRAQLGLADTFTVGIQGNFTWFPKLGGGLGVELVEALALLDDPRVHVILIGAGPGLEQLRRRAAERHVADRLHVLGYVPYADLARYLGLCDVCLLTQTDDPSSRIRTTGKLPCYLACGRYIVASRVGTAAQILPEEMLLDYHGDWDTGYPARLANRLAQLASDPDRAAKGLELTALASRFDYDRVAAEAATVVRTLLDRQAA
jgi:glycosyltransferase involved in cell wall biosynthesis